MTETRIWENRIIGVDEVDPVTLVQNPDNFREHGEAQRLAWQNVAKKVGWIQHVIVNKRTGHLIDGHMRVEEAIHAGAKTVPVVYVDLSEEEEKVALANFDPLGSMATIRQEQLDKLIQETSQSVSLVEEVIHSLSEQSDQTPTPIKEKIEKIDSETVDLVSKWNVEPGALWKIESKSNPGSYHRLICGDSSDEAIISKLMNGQIAVLMVTDPPYGVSFEEKYNPRSKDWDKIVGDEKRGLELREWLGDIIKKWMPYLTQDAAFYLWSAMMEEGFSIFYALQDNGIKVRSQIVWAKNAFSLGQADYQWKHEICWYGFSKKGGHKWYGGRAQTTVWDIKKIPNMKYSHPMQKPTELYSVPIGNHTLPGQLVVDPFVGCGTQIVAAEEGKRVCYACDCEPKWIAVALERLEKMGLNPRRVE